MTTPDFLFNPGPSMDPDKAFWLTMVYAGLISG